MTTATERKPGSTTAVEAEGPSRLAGAASFTAKGATARSGPMICTREEKRGSWETTSKSTIKKPRVTAPRRSSNLLLCQNGYSEGFSSPVSLIVKMC